VRTAALPDTRHGMRDEQLLTALLTDGSSEQTVPGITGSTALVRREREGKDGVRHTRRATARTATTGAIRTLPR